MVMSAMMPSMADTMTTIWSIIVPDLHVATVFEFQ